jgi:hypothetical protein
LQLLPVAYYHLPLPPSLPSALTGVVTCVSGMECLGQLAQLLPVAYYHLPLPPGLPSALTGVVTCVSGKLFLGQLAQLLPVSYYHHLPLTSLSTQWTKVVTYVSGTGKKYVLTAYSCSLSFLLSYYPYHLVYLAWMTGVVVIVLGEEHLDTVCSCTNLRISFGC